MRTFVRWLVALVALAGLPFAALATYGVYHHRNLGAALRSLGSTGSGHHTNTGPLERGPYADAVYMGNLERWELEEISGLAPSHRRNDLLWGVNDSGNLPALYAIGLDGRDLGRSRVRGSAGATDWEDLSAFEMDGRPYLLVGDVGDNLVWRPQVVLLAIEEPVVGPDGPPKHVDVSWRIPIEYEDGPHDCEAFAVDVTSGQVLLITKRDNPPVLYGFELGAAHDEHKRIAQRLGELVRLPEPSDRDRAEDFLHFYTRSQPTALDISPDGRVAVVLTYKDAYQFVHAAGETWAETFAHTPLRIPVPPMPQKESLAFARDGRSFFVTTERRPMPLFRFDLREPSGR